MEYKMTKERALKRLYNQKIKLLKDEVLGSVSLRFWNRDCSSVNDITLTCWYPMISKLTHFEYHKTELRAAVQDYLAISRFVKKF